MPGEYEVVEGRLAYPDTRRDIWGLERYGDTIHIFAGKHAIVRFGNVYQIPASELGMMCGELAELSEADGSPMPAVLAKMTESERTITGAGGELYISSGDQAFPVTVFSTRENVSHEAPEGGSVQIKDDSIIRLAYEYAEGGQWKIGCVYLYVHHPEGYEDIDPRDWVVLRIEQPPDGLRDSELHEYNQLVSQYPSVADGSANKKAFSAEERWADFRIQAYRRRDHTLYYRDQQP